MDDDHLKRESTKLSQSIQTRPAPVRASTASWLLSNGTTRLGTRYYKADHIRRHLCKIPMFSFSFPTRITNEQTSERNTSCTTSRSCSIVYTNTSSANETEADRPTSYIIHFKGNYSCCCLFCTADTRAMKRRRRRNMSEQQSSYTQYYLLLLPSHRQATAASPFGPALTS